MSDASLHATRHASVTSGSGTRQQNGVILVRPSRETYPLYSQRQVHAGRMIASETGNCLLPRKVRAPWTNCQVTPGHGVSTVTESATENKPPVFRYW